MRVLFDVWIRDDGNVVYTHEQDLLFKTVHDYIYDRVHHIIDEIDKEEAEEDPNSPKAIVVCLIDEPKRIVPARYSDRLTDRIIGCFNENDAKIMWESVAKEIKKLRN